MTVCVRSHTILQQWEQTLPPSSNETKIHGFGKMHAFKQGHKDQEKLLEKALKGDRSPYIWPALGATQATAHLLVGHGSGFEQGSCVAYRC